MLTDADTPSTNSCLLLPGQECSCVYLVQGWRERVRPAAGRGVWGLYTVHTCGLRGLQIVL